MRTIEIKFYDNEDTDINICLSVTDDELGVLKTIFDRYGKSLVDLFDIIREAESGKEEWVLI